MDDNTYIIHIPEVGYSEGKESSVLDHTGRPYIVKTPYKLGFDLSNKKETKCIKY